MAVLDIIGLQIHGRYQNQNIVNTIHYQITEQVSNENDVLQQLVDNWVFINRGAWIGRHIDTYTLMGLKGFSVTGDNKRPGIAHIADAGLVTGTEVPSPVCRVLTLYTNSDNYRRRGRVMLSGSETLQFEDSDGSVTAAEIVLMEVLGASLIVDIDGEGDNAQPGLAPVAGPPALPFEAFTSVLGRKTPALIRSRRVRSFGIG